jgi:hypothetical protein
VSIRTWGGPAHPVEWVGARLAGLETLLAEAGVAADPAYAGDGGEPARLGWL